MKQTIGPVFGAGAGILLVLGSAGCAGDRYHQSTGEYIDDHSLQLRVDRALYENPDYKFKEVSVATFKGNVQLNGFVDTSAQKTAAEDMTKQIPGVRQVENNILVEDNRRTAGQAEDDKTLAENIRKSLHDNPEYKFDDVTVVVHQGTVQLAGFADTADQKTHAADIARQDAGDKDVKNEITVKESMNP